MIREAQVAWTRFRNTKFVLGKVSPRIADFSVASGIFNVKLHHTPAQWESYVAQTLRELHATSSLGFAVNFLAPISGDLDAVDELYRTPPDIWRSFCEHELGCRTELIDRYGMREFTLLVQRQIRS